MPYPELEELYNTYRTDLRFQWELPLEEQFGRPPKLRTC